MRQNAVGGISATLGLPELTRKEFLRVRDLAHANFGLELRDGKERLVASRLTRFLRTGKYTSFSHYLDYVASDRTGESLVDLIDALSTNHTSFFREQRHFDFLTSRILPAHRSRLRIWSAACSTGEEPYSIAMSVLEVPAQVRPLALSILASDISSRALNAARTGVYTGEQLQHVPVLLRSKYFDVAADRRYGIRGDVRSIVRFQRINLMEPVRSTEPFDVIFCRNVMIYFNRSTQEGVIQRLVQSLAPGGYLFVGHSESLTGITHGLEYVEPAIYRCPDRAKRPSGGRR